MSLSRRAVVPCTLWMLLTGCGAAEPAPSLAAVDSALEASAPPRP